MRSFSFRAKNIGSERYLTYVMGEGCELDEDMLDYIEENDIKELVSIIYEEDDDYDYLTYDISGKMTLDTFLGGTMSREKVFRVLRNIALSLVNCKEQTIKLTYIIINKKFIYINPDTLELEFMCLPIESKGSVATEFKGFIRQLLANMKYDVDEDLSYVGQLLTYINGDSFNLRGLIGLSEALMEDAGISFEEESIATDDGSEIVNSVEEEPAEEAEEKDIASDFLSGFNSGDSEALPEIGDDDEEDYDDDDDYDAGVGETDVLKATVSSIFETAATEEPVKKEEVKEEPAEKPAAEEAQEEPQVQRKIRFDDSRVEPIKEAPKTESIEDIKARLEKIMKQGSVAADITAPPTMQTKPQVTEEEDIDDIVASSSRPTIKKTTVKVNRAALIMNAAELEHEAAAEDEEDTFVLDPTVSSSKSDRDNSVIEDLSKSDAKAPAAKAEESKSTEAKTEQPESQKLMRGGFFGLGGSPIGGTKPGNTGTLKICPYLVRVNTEERIMISKSVFKIGKATRGVDYRVDGNGAISRQHAIIMEKDGHYVIKDNKSTNHTYINGKQVEDGKEEELIHDCLVRLGDEEFVFKIR